MLWLTVLSGVLLAETSLAVSAVTTAAPPTIYASVEISSLSTAVTLNKSFSLSCYTGFDPLSTNYTVKFWSDRYGLLGTYEIGYSDDHVNVHFKPQHQPATQIKNGLFSFHPTFMVDIIEHQNDRQIYWCTLEDSTLLKGRRIVSANRWPQHPVVEMIPVSSPTNLTQHSICTLKNFNTSASPYSVHFYSDIGNREINLLASHVNTPREFGTFVSDKVAGWKSIKAWKSSIKEIELVAQLDHPTPGRLWCELEVFNAGLDEAQFYRSNELHLNAAPKWL